MQLEIITPDAKLFNGEVISIKLPGVQGSFEVLNEHAPIISTLTSGTISISTEHGNPQFFDINSGVVEVQNNKIIILAD